MTVETMDGRLVVGSDGSFKEPAGTVVRAEERFHFRPDGGLPGTARVEQRLSRRRSKVQRFSEEGFDLDPRGLTHGRSAGLKARCSQARAKVQCRLTVAGATSRNSAAS